MSALPKQPTRTVAAIGVIVQDAHTARRNVATQAATPDGIHHATAGR